MENLSQYTDLFVRLGIQYGTNVVLFLVLLFITWRVSKWTNRSIISVVNRKNLDPALGRFFASLGQYAILVTGSISCLGLLGIETASFAAVLAASGFAVGMALQGTLSHFASGVMILIFRPFNINDVISVAGTTGKVVAIDLFTTTLDTPDNRRFIIPNGAVYGQLIENISYHDLRRVDVTLGTAYDADIDSTRKILKEAAESLSAVLKDPEAAVVLTSLGASSIDWSVRVWVKKEDYWGVMDELTRVCKYSLDKSNIGIPFPQMELHLAESGLPLAGSTSTATQPNQVQ